MVSAGCGATNKSISLSGNSDWFGSVPELEVLGLRLPDFDRFCVASVFHSSMVCVFQHGEGLCSVGAGTRLPAHHINKLSRFRKHRMMIRKGHRLRTDVIGNVGSVLHGASDGWVRPSAPLVNRTSLACAAPGPAHDGCLRFQGYRRRKERTSDDNASCAHGSDAKMHDVTSTEPSLREDQTWAKNGSTLCVQWKRSVIQPQTQTDAWPGT